MKERLDERNVLKYFLLFCFGLIIVGAIVPSVFADPQYTIQEISLPIGFSPMAVLGINDNGQALLQSNSGNEISDYFLLDTRDGSVLYLNNDINSQIPVIFHQARSFAPTGLNNFAIIGFIEDRDTYTGRPIANRPAIYDLQTSQLRILNANPIVNGQIVTDPVARAINNREMLIVHGNSNGLTNSYLVNAATTPESYILIPREPSPSMPQYPPSQDQSSGSINNNNVLTGIRVVPDVLLQDPLGVNYTVGCKRGTYWSAVSGYHIIEPLVDPATQLQDISSSIFGINDNNIAVGYSSRTSYSPTTGLFLDTKTLFTVNTTSGQINDKLWVRNGVPKRWTAVSVRDMSINNNGVIAAALYGITLTSAGANRDYIMRIDPDGHIYFLNDIIPANSGWTFTSANTAIKINNHNEIFGIGRRNGQNSFFVASPVLPILRGDMNCDGSVNNFDIDAFVLALINPNQYLSQNPTCSLMHGDVDNNGLFNNFDIEPFVSVIVNG